MWQKRLALLLAKYTIGKVEDKEMASKVLNLIESYMDEYEQEHKHTSIWTNNDAKEFIARYKSITNIDPIDLAIKDLLQLTLLMRKGISVEVEREIKDSIMDYLGWLEVHFSKYPQIQDLEFIVTKDEIERYKSTMQVYNDFYKMKDMEKRKDMQARGLVIEEKIIRILNACQSSNTGYDMVYQGFKMDIKSSTAKAYNLPYHRLAGEWDYIFMVKVEDMGSYMKCKLWYICDRIMLERISINTLSKIIMLE